MNQIPEPHSAKILLVEDDDAFRKTLARYLARQGMTVFETGVFSEAEQIAGQERPALALLDINLGEDSGLSLIAPLRRANPDCRIVMLSGCTEIAFAVAATKMGAADYLVKPVEGEAILSGLLAERTNDFRMPQQECMPLEELEKSHITRVLAANKGNISRTAQVLDMHRRTLQRKLSKFLPSSRGAAARSSAFGE